MTSTVSPYALARSDVGATGRTLAVRPVTTLDGLRALQPLWDELLGRCAYRDVFMTHAWALAWWTHFGQGRQLTIDVVYDDGVPVGLAPLMISRETYGGLPARVLGFLTNNHTSRSAFVIPRQRAAVLRALAAHWRRRAGDWDVLRLLHLPRRSEQMADVVAALRAERLLVFGPERSNQLHYAIAAAPFKAYLAGRDRKFKRNINHARNCLARAGRITTEVVTDVAQLEAGLATLFGLDQHSHKQGVANAIYTRTEKEFCASLCRALACRPESGFELWILKVDERPICSLLVLLHEAKSLLLVTYYDERLRDLQPGRNLFADVVESQCNGDRVTEIDFNGNSPYVQTWTSHSDVFDGLSACHRRPYSLLIAASKTLKRLTARQRDRLAGHLRRRRAASLQTPELPPRDQAAGP